MMIDPLRGYHEILAGQRRSSFLRLKEHRLSLPDGLSTEELWRIHSREMELFRSGSESGSGEVDLLQLKAELACRLLENCHLCERGCGADRASGEEGHCGVLEPLISSDFLHMGEEPPLVPSYTVFFAGCTFECVFCQNYDISTNPRAGIHLEPEVMADRIERRAFPTGKGDVHLSGRARNVNWVGGEPTPNIPYILRVLGLCNCDLSQIWNSNMYLSRESMDLLDGVMDIYLTDFKYGNDDCALRLSNAPRYWEVITRNHILAVDQGEVIVRHLVMPNHLECCTFPILEWLSENLGGAVVNVMAQYRPMHRAMEHEDIAVPLRMEEYLRAKERALEVGLRLID